MRVLVCGSRSWDDSARIRVALKGLPRGTEIISGGARGADKLAATVARGIGFQVTEFLPNWRPNGVYNSRAGIERNLVMLDQNPDLVIAFWDGRSTGTAHTLSEAEKRHIPCVKVLP